MMRAAALLPLPLLLVAPLALSGQEGTASALTRLPFVSAPRGAGVTVLPLTLRSALNTGWTDDRDNGALWAGKGVSGLLRGGIGYRAGPLNVVLAPEVTFAGNGAFPLADGVRAGYSAYSAPWLPVDLPRRWGDGAARGVHPGQSLVEVRWPAFAVGATSANLVRGPEHRYPVMMGASAPGVPGVYLEGGGPVPLLGRVVARAQWGVLRESPFFDEEADNDRTLLSTFFMDWEPGFAPRLTLGATVSYRDPLTDGFRTSMLWQAFSTISAQAPEQQEEDGLAAVHALWRGESLDLWASWGRGDYWLDTEDLLTDPDHNQVWVLGASTRWSSGGRRWRLATEVASLYESNPRTGPFYRHSRSRQGYTHQGQMLGASVGPGARSAWISVERADGARSVGVEVERVLRDLDTYETFRRRDGADGQDREWRLGALYEGPAPGFGDAPVSLRLNGGVSLRWNRDYIRYSDNADLVGPRESQIFLDVALTWDPRAKG